MTLRTRILLLLLAVVAGFVVVDSVVQRALASRRFGGYELDFARLRLDDVRERIDIKQNRLAQLAREHGIKLSHELGRNPGAVPELGAHDLDLLFLVDSHGRVLSSAAVDPKTREPIRLREFPEQALSPANPLLDPSSTGGFVQTDLGLMLIGVFDIESASRTSPALRTLAGSFVDAALVNDLSPSRNITARLSTLSDSELSGEDFGVALGREMPSIELLSDEMLSAEDVLMDVRGMPAILLRIWTPRDFAQLARESASDATLSGASVATLLLLTLVFLLERGVVRPVRALTEHAILIGETDNTTMRLNSERKDEIGSLARELDRMVAELDRSRNQAADVARNAGAAEIATGVLHNIGNVLNSVNVAAQISARSVARLPLDDLGLGVRELEKHSDDLGRYMTEDPRGKHFASFLCETHVVLVKSREGIQEEMLQLLGNVEHIASLVQAHGGLARSVSATTWTQTEEIVEHALDVAVQARHGSVRARIVRDYEPTAAVELERHKVVEILVNLMLNAFDAVEGAAVEDPQVVLRLITDEDSIALEVQDNGPGIEPEDAERIFQLGFTTKANGQGFGLHMSALAATEIGGRLEVREATPGMGATFRLTLPAVASSAAA